MAQRRRRDLDGVDRELIALLAADPRSRQRDLARSVGIADETVSARLRRLREDNVIATTVLVDWRAAGYEVGVILRLSTQLPGTELQALLDDIPGFHYLARTLGGSNMLAALVATDLKELWSSVNRVKAIVGVDVDSTEVVVDTPVYSPEVMTLPLHPWRPSELPSPEPALDALDEALVRTLILDAHESNRELARRLGVSDGTVRSRLQRLEEGGLMQRVTGYDPVAIGDITTFGLAFVTLDSQVPSLDALDHASVLAAHETLGSANLVLQIGTSSEHDFGRLVATDLRNLPGVQRLDALLVTEVIHHRAHLVRLSAQRRSIPIAREGPESASA